MKKISLLLLSIMLAFVAQSATIRGKVVNKKDGSIIEMATVRILTQDSSLVTGAQSDMNGAFAIENVSKGKYILLVSSVGYQSNGLKKVLSVGSSDINVGTITLQEDVQVLSELDVKGKAAEMVVKGDTIEYNTSAYKVSENAMVEDLLKKMNGVSVDQQGNVTVNGENITAVRVDGKKFFGSDVQAATKNLPAEMIDKIQVIDEKSDVAKMTGFDDDESEHIINLTTKKAYKKGAFGKYTGGLGADMVTDNGKWFNYGDPAYGATAWDRTKHFFSNDFRYNANLFTNLLLGESQTTIMGSANNTNEMRMGRGRGKWGNDANSGITWSEMLGINTNEDLTSKITPLDRSTKLLFGGDVSVNHGYNDLQSQQDKTSLTDDATFHNTDTTISQRHATDVNVRLELEYQIDSLNKLLIQPTFSYNGQHGAKDEAYTYENDSVLVNHGEQTTVDSTRTISGGGRITYNHKFLHPGRSITITANITGDDTKGVSKTIATDKLHGTTTVDQHTTSGSNSLNYSVRASYVEPLGKPSHLLEIAVGMDGNHRKSSKDQYSKDDVGEYVYDSIYSNRLVTDMYTESMEANYRWLSAKTDLTVGAKVMATQTASQTYYGQRLEHDTLYNIWNWSPTIKFKYKFGKKEFARIRYRGTMSQPSINQMTPVRNNSDAMNETVGNLGLEPAFKHSLHVMYSRYNEKRYSSLMTGVHANLTKDALVTNTIYDLTGKCYQQTVNADMLPWDINADLMYNTPFANKLMQFNTRTDIGYNQRVGYVLREQDAATIASLIASNQLPLGERSISGNLRVSEDINLRLTHDWVDVGVQGNVTYSRTSNNLAKEASNVLDWTVRGDVAIHLPKSWEINTDIGYTARYGYTGVGQTNELLWNASVEKTWTNATLSLQVYDLLHQKKNIVQVVSDNSISYAKYNTLPTYFMLTFTYKMNKMRGNKAKGHAGFMQEMLENGQEPGKGGMPPMGPPPGPPPGM